MHLLIVFLLYAAFGFAESPFVQTWSLGGGLTVQFQSDAPFDFNDEDRIKLSAHLPGFQVDSKGFHELVVKHIFSDSWGLKQEPGKVEISSTWREKLPADFIHLLYGASRLEWLQRDVFAVHAACIGNDRDGYVLLMGVPGSGKTTLTLNQAAHHGYKVFSGDKTLLRFTEDGQMEAIAGTQTITIRARDISRWAALEKVDSHSFDNRLAFQLKPECYSKLKSVPIKQIFLVGLNEGGTTHSMLTPLSALHHLYPLFLDKQREDTLIGGGLVFFDGSTPKEGREKLAKNLSAALQKIPVYQTIGSMEDVSAFIRSKGAPKKVLIGICGIGNGHINRQLPVIKHLLENGHDLLIFTYGEGLTYFRDNFPKHLHLTVLPVADPYYVGSPEGLDFEKTARSEKNKVDFVEINSMAMSEAGKVFGKPDLVISDYEMVAAQYAYAKQARLLTFDQQSKYLVGKFSPNLNGTSYLDEVERLCMFFPKADKRMAISFFKVEENPRNNNLDVEVLAPMLRPEVLAAKGQSRSIQPSIVVYVTAQQLGDQPVHEWIQTIKNALPNDFEAHLFLPKRMDLPKDVGSLHFYHHGDSRFDPILFVSHGIISTAGHTLLSEAMYLEKPVLALPLPLYEQQLNAYIMAAGGFGLCEQDLSEESLKIFFNNLDVYSDNIRKDKQWLIKEPGNAIILQKIDQML
jgi:uncharacterized protein (TIGR00661 family)